MKRWPLTTPAVVLTISVAAACGGYNNDGSNGSGAHPAANSGQGAAPGTGSSGPWPSDAGAPWDAGAAAPGAGTGGGTPTPPPPSSPPPPTTAQYVRGSLTPVYGLIPRSQYGNNAPPVNGEFVALQDSDMEANSVTTSALQKEGDIGALIAQDNGGTPVTVITNAEDQQRSSLIPFRGKPSDVKFVSLNGQTQLFVPLGGDVQIVGDEVSVISVANGNLTPTQRITVGERPQRLAVHPAGLVFACNQYSNYISIIDPRTNQLLMNGATPVEIKTEYMCSDLAFVPAPDNNPDHQFI